MIVVREVQPQLEIVVHGCEAQGGGILVTLGVKGKCIQSPIPETERADK